MEVSYGQMVTVLRALHPGVEASILARLQYFQRENFPFDRRSGAARTDYGAEGLMKLALAFELLAAGTPPGYAIRLVQDGWEAASETIGSAWGARRVHRNASLIFVRINGLGARIRDVGQLGAGSADDLRQWLQGNGSGRSVLVVDALRLVQAVGAAVDQNDSDVDISGIETAMNGWADRRRKQIWT